MRSTGMCYECMTSADCTPPNTCDPPPDGDGTCGFELGLLIISKDGEKGTTQTTHPPRYDTRPVGSDKYLVFNLQQLLSQSAHVQ